MSVRVKLPEEPLRHPSISFPVALLVPMLDCEPELLGAATLPELWLPELCVSELWLPELAPGVWLLPEL